MMLISERYATEQQRLHEVDPKFGAEGYQWGYLIAGIAQVEACATILDYGCGKGTLRRYLVERTFIEVAEYDPGVPGKDTAAEPADLTVCLDVMEHIEPDCIDAVMADLVRVSRKLLFVVVSTKLSKRIMADGRDTHLSLHDDAWWMAAFTKRGFKIKRTWNTGLRLWVALLQPPARSC